MKLFGGGESLGGGRQVSLGDRVVDHVDAVGMNSGHAAPVGKTEINMEVSTDDTGVVERVTWLQTLTFRTGEEQYSAFSTRKYK